jgi:hypothetical protein
VKLWELMIRGHSDTPYKIICNGECINLLGCDLLNSKLEDKEILEIGHSKDGIIVKLS